jgi:hypothetical protein
MDRPRPPQMSRSAGVQPSFDVLSYGRLSSTGRPPYWSGFQIQMATSAATFSHFHKCSDRIGPFRRYGLNTRRE